MRLAIAYVHPGWVHEQFASSLRRYCTAFPDTVIVSARSGPTLARARNDVIHRLIDVGSNAVDMLLWIDTDMTFEIDDINDLVNSVNEETPIVSALCYGLDYPTGEIFVASTPRLEEDDIDGDMREVRATGMAFTAMSMATVKEIVEQNPFPYQEFWDPDLGMVGEDVGFCLAAGRAGFGVFVHTGIKVGHIKEMVI